MSEFFPTAVYLLCFAASVTCAVLLARSYLAGPARLLLWSSICFSLLAANNLVVVVDMLLIPEVSLRLLRLILALCAVGTLLFGFIWERE